MTTHVIGRGSSRVHMLRGTGMSNTYVLGSRRRLVVVDPGAASSAGSVLDFVTQELKRKPADIGTIVVTHLHCDHIGGVAELQGETGATVALGKAARDYVEGRREMRWAPVSRWIAMMKLYKSTGWTMPSLRDLARMPWTGSPLARRHGTPFRVGRWLKDGETVGDTGRWKVVASPGHTDDSICLFDGKSNALVSGDVILGVDGRPLFNPFFAFDAEQVRTERRLRQLGARCFLPGHGLPVFEGEP